MWFLFTGIARALATTHVAPLQTPVRATHITIANNEVAVEVSTSNDRRDESHGFQKTVDGGADVTLCGAAFHSLEPATGKARLLTVDRRLRQTNSRDESRMRVRNVTKIYHRCTGL